MSDASAKFEGWAVVEMLGHKKLAGLVSEQLLAGAALVRVDVPETTHAAYTKFIGVGSVYCITPCSEEVARKAAAVLEQWNDPIPVQLPRMIPAVSGASSGAADDFDELVEPDEDDDIWGS